MISTNVWLKTLNHNAIKADQIQQSLQAAHHGHD